MSLKDELKKAEAERLEKKKAADAAKDKDVASTSVPAPAWPKDADPKPAPDAEKELKELQEKLEKLEAAKKVAEKRAAEAEKKASEADRKLSEADRKVAEVAKKATEAEKAAAEAGEKAAGTKMAVPMGYAVKGRALLDSMREVCDDFDSQVSEMENLEAILATPADELGDAQHVWKYKDKSGITAFARTMGEVLKLSDGTKPVETWAFIVSGKFLELSAEQKDMFGLT